MRTVTTLLLATIVALVSLSLTMLASATALDSGASVNAPMLDASIRNQLIATLVGFIGLGIAASMDYRKTRRWSWVVYGVTLVLLILVLTPLGHETKGARRWLFGTQPSEIAKLALIIVLANYGAYRQNVIQRFWKGLGLGCLIALPILALVAAEPDRGTTALLMVVTMIMLLLAGVRWLFVIPPVVAGTAALAAMIWFSPMAQDRWRAWWDPDSHKATTGMQVRKSLQAFAVGGFEGQGLAAGAQKFRVPEVHTDFILPAVGEDLGLFGSLGVLSAYVIVLVCGVMIAYRAADLHGLLLAAGITFLICAQTTVNIGVVTALLPNKGMPLPFVSRGGSSIAILLTLVGVLLSVARQAGNAEDSDAATEHSGRTQGRGRNRTNPFANPDFAPVE